MAETAAVSDHGTHELRHLGEYTRVLKKLLPRRAFEPVPHRVLWALPHLAAIVGGILAVGLLEIHWALKLVVSLVIGGSIASLGFLGHEILHGSVLKTPWLRNLAGQICLWPFCIGPRLWRRWHNVEHHGHTQHEHDDPDAMHTLDDLHERPALKWIYRPAPWLRAILTLALFGVWFSLHAFQMLLRYAPTFPPRERWIVIAQFTVPAASWLALAAWIGPADWLFAYAIPLAVGNFIAMSYISTNHLLSPLTPINDPLANSLTVKVPRLVDILHLNFSHHTEHHIFPAMNPRHAPQVKALCRRLWPDRYHEMPHWRAVLMVCLTPRVYYRYRRLVDPVRRLVYPVVGEGLEQGLRAQRLED